MAKGLRYTVRAWVDEPQSEGEYEIRAASSLDAVEQAKYALINDCIAAAAFVVPEQDEIDAEVVGVHA